MQNYAKASDVRPGDIISGPDGPSTVVSIDHTADGAIKFSFAEGNGNRNFLARPAKLIAVLERSEDEKVSGFVVDTDGNVVMKGVVTAIERGDVLEFTHANGGKKTSIPKRKIRHITGSFTYIPSGT